jgi:hypothetical protein
MFLIFLTINLYGPLRKNRQIIRDLKRRYALNAQVPPMSAGAGSQPSPGSETIEEERT